MNFDDRDFLLQIPHLRRFAVSLLRNRDRADDLVQDCLVRAISKRKQFKAGTNLRSWLFAILHNLFVDQQRRRGCGFTANGVHDAIDRLKVEPEQGNHVFLRELGEAIAELPYQHSFLLLLVTVEGFNYKEAAAVAGIPVGTVRSRLSRARLALREKLETSDRREAINPNESWQKSDQRGRTEYAAGR